MWDLQLRNPRVLPWLNGKDSITAEVVKLMGYSVYKGELFGW